MHGFIHSTDSFGTVDGPGIRFVVFFQGCPMRCLYCHNPDTWEIGKGTSMSTDELIAMYERNQEFAKGGITATGGEPMLQLPFLTELFSKAKERGIHTCLDSSGICFDPRKSNEFQSLMRVTNLVMLDIKHINSERHRTLTKQDNANILAFARFVAESNVEIWIRHVVVPTLTDDPYYHEELGYFIASLSTLKALDVLPYHDMGRVKYEALGMEYPLQEIEPLSKEEAIVAKGNILKGMKRYLREH